jgi:hypothetical protein
LEDPYVQGGFGFAEEKPAAASQVVAEAGPMIQSMKAASTVAIKRILIRDRMVSSPFPLIKGRKLKNRTTCFQATRPSFLPLKDP